MNKTRGIKNAESGTFAEPLEPREMLAVVTWDGGPTGTGTTYSDAANWVGDVLPGVNDTALIDTAGPEIQMSSIGIVSIQNMISSRAVRLRGSTVIVTTGISQFSATLFMQSGGTLRGGSWQFSGGAELDIVAGVGGSQATLEDTTTNSPIRLNVELDAVRLRGNTTVGPIFSTARSTAIGLFAGTTLNSSITFSGGVASTDERQFVVFSNGTGPTVTIATGVSLTLAPSFQGTLRMGAVSATVTLVNDGTITNQSAGTVSIENGSFLNNSEVNFGSGNGSITSNAGWFWRNAGVIRGGAGGTVTLGGVWDTTAGAGVLDTGATSLRLQARVLNTGNTLTFNASTGAPFVPHATNPSIVGGTLIMDGVDFGFTGATTLLRLDNVSNPGTIRINTGTLEVAGSFGGTLILQGQSPRLAVLQNTVLSAQTTVNPTSVGTSYVTLGIGTTLAPSASVSLASTAIAALRIDVSQSSRNDGTIRNLSATQTLTFGGVGEFRNMGLIETTGAPLSFNVGGAGARNLGTIRGAAGTRIELRDNFYFGTGVIEGASSEIAIVGRVYMEGSTLQINPTTPRFTMLDGYLHDGTVQFSGGRELVVSTAQFGNVLTNVNVLGVIRVMTNCRIQLDGTTRFTSLELSNPGSQASMNTGYILHDRITASGAGTGLRRVTLSSTSGPNVEISPTGVIELDATSASGLDITSSSPQLRNLGLIENRNPTQELKVAPGSIENLGTIRAAGGTVRIWPGQSWTNNGIIAATNSGTMFLHATYLARNATGTFETSGGTLYLAGIYDNTLTTTTVTADVGVMRVTGELFGGTLVQAGGRLTGIGFGRVRDITITEPVDIREDEAMTIQGAISFPSMSIVGNNAFLSIEGTYTLTAPITIGGTGTVARGILLGRALGAAHLTISPTGSISASGSYSGRTDLTEGSAGSFTNLGQVLVNAPSSMFTLRHSIMSNQGLIQVTASRFDLYASGSPIFRNTGTIQVIDTPVMNWSGSIDRTAGTGTFFAPGVTVNKFTGTILNTGASLPIGGDAGNWIFSNQTITGGTVDVAPGSKFVTTGSSNSPLVLNSVAINGNADIQGGILRLLGTSTVNGVIELTGPSTVAVGTGNTLRSAVVASGPSTAARAVILGFGTTGTLHEITSAGSLEVLPGTGGNLTISANSGTIRNDGVIRLRDASRTIQINAIGFQNQGTLDALAGTISLAVNGSAWVNSGTIEIGGTGRILTTHGAGMTSTGTATLNITIASATQAGKLEASAGVITLGGTLTLVQPSGVDVPRFSSFQLLLTSGAASLAGEIATVILPDVVIPNSKWFWTQTATGFSASLTSAADFNQDMVVDFFDYLDFVAAFSSGDNLADFNNDGTIDFFDYLDFVAAFAE